MNIKRLVYSLVGAVAVGSMAVFSGPVSADEGKSLDKSPVLCTIDDTSGNLATMASRKVYGYRLAVKEINEAGGVLGKPIEHVEYDGQSSTSRYQDLTQRCIFSDKADVVMAGYTGAQRAAARGVAERNQTIMWHNNQDEGGIASHYFFHSGPAPEQQMLSTFPYMIDKFGTDIAFIGADYNYCRQIGDWVRVAAGLKGGNVVMEEYFPFEQSNWTSTINKIQGLDPDFQVHCLVGGNQTQFYPAAEAAGLDIPAWSNVTVEDGYEHKRFSAPALANLYTPPSFAEELTTKEAQDFVKRLKNEYPDMGYVSEHTAFAYIAVKAMAKAWERAGTTETEAVIDALEEGISLPNSPVGKWQLYGDQHYAGMPTYLFRVNEEHDLELIETFDFTPASFIKKLGVDLREKGPDFSKTLSPRDVPEWEQYFEN
jgi:branched-chain amino acid transport system substrate-binding protein